MRVGERGAVEQSAVDTSRRPSPRLFVRLRGLRAVSCLRAPALRRFRRRDQHRERIAGRRAPTLTLTSVRPARAACASARSSLKPSQRSPSFARTHSSSCSRRSSTSTRPPGTDDARRFGERAPDRAAWCSACDSSATSTLASCSGSFSSSPRFQMTLRHAPAPRQRLGARRARRRTDRRRSPASPSGRLDRQVAFAAAEVGDAQRRQQSARARATRPPSSGPARAAARRRVRPAVRLEVLLPQPPHFLPAAPRRPATGVGRRPTASNCASSSAPSGAGAVAPSASAGAAR